MNLLPLFSLFTLTSATSFPLERSLNPPSKASSSEYRLPLVAYPVHYDLTVEPNFTNFSFKGETSINLKIVEETDNITLHANNLTITTEGVRFGNAEGNIKVIDLVYTSRTQFLTIVLEREVTKGYYVLNISYEGYLDNNNKGFYRASYEDSAGETRWFATTHLEPAYARNAFPCFDEPALKAEFTISIIRSSDYSSISNMNLDYSTVIDNDQVKDTFQRSVKMSTYLVAFVVSDFANVSSGNHSVFGRQDLIEEGRGDYALDTGVNTLNILEEYTDVSYPIGKMYQVGIPDDYFTAGAMENWGIVIYKERHLLYKENVSTSNEKQLITIVIAHEFAHQWFGNLVTPSWWKYIWLNEGFATYFSYYVASLVEPTWKLMDQMVVTSVQQALLIDSLKWTRPMASDAGSPEEISRLFDIVVYDKAGAVIRMMEHIVTTEVFQKGLREYLDKRSYLTAEPSMLWSILDFNLGIGSTLPPQKNVEDVMETWTSQSGYPLLNVERNYEDGSITFSQNRFILENATGEHSEIYIVPINFATSDHPDFEETRPFVWLLNASSPYKASLNNTSWLVVNLQQTGYYRVNYDTQNWKLIISYLKSENFEEIHVLNRAQLLDDAFNLAYSGLLSYKTLFELLEYIVNETDFIPLLPAVNGLANLDRLISGTEYYDKFQEFIAKILETAYEKLGTELNATEPIPDVLNRINVIRLMCLYGGSDCRGNMTAQLSSKSDIHPDLQEPVYCGGMREGSSDEWDYLYQLYDSNNTEEMQKSRLFSALGCSLNRTLLERLLNASLYLEANYTIRERERVEAFSATCSASYFGVQTSYDFFLERFEDIRDSFSFGEIWMILSTISYYLSTSDELQRFQDFIGSQSEEVNSTFIPLFNMTLENINHNLQWYNRSASGISSYFENNTLYGYNTTTTVTSSTATTTSTSTTNIPTTSATTETTTEATNSVGILKNSFILLAICLFTTFRVYI